jgi:hypothetical protein
MYAKSIGSTNTRCIQDNLYTIISNLGQHKPPTYKCHLGSTQTGYIQDNLHTISSNTGQYTPPTNNCHLSTIHSTINGTKTTADQSTTTTTCSTHPHPPTNNRCSHQIPAPSPPLLSLAITTQDHLGPPLPPPKLQLPKVSPKLNSRICKA